MRKLRCLLFLLCLTVSLVGCGERPVETEEDLLAIITSELDLNITVQKIGIIDLDDVVLVSYMTGNENQEPAYGYAEFEKQKNNYKFMRIYPMMDRGMDLRSAIYNDSYLFVVNNETCKSLRISRVNGKANSIIVDKIPFIYYLENALNSNFEYQFLDKDDKEISP